MDCHDYLSTTQDNNFNNLSSINNSIFNCEKTYSDGLMSIKKHNKIIKQKDAIIQSQKEAIERFSIANKPPLGIKNLVRRKRLRKPDALNDNESFNIDESTLKSYNVEICLESSEIGETYDNKCSMINDEPSIGHVEIDQAKIDAALRRLRKQQLKNDKSLHKSVKIVTSKKKTPF
jgi:hypothetical protein